MFKILSLLLLTGGAFNAGFALKSAAETKVKEPQNKVIKDEGLTKRQKDCLTEKVGNKIANYDFNSKTQIYEGNFDWTKTPNYFKSELQLNLSFCLEHLK